MRDLQEDVFNLMTEGITRNIFKGLFCLRLLSWLVNSKMDSSSATDQYFFNLDVVHDIAMEAGFCRVKKRML